MESARADLLLSKKDSEPVLDSEAFHGQGDTLSILPARRHEPCCSAAYQRVDQGCAEFVDIHLGAPPPGMQPYLFLPSMLEKAGNSPKGDQSPPEVLSTAQEPLRGTNRSDGTTAEPSTAAYLGGYLDVKDPVRHCGYKGRGKLSWGMGLWVATVVQARHVLKHPRGRWRCVGYG